MAKTLAVIIDLDGTLYNATERRNRCFPEGGAKDFPRWNRESKDDPPNAWCVGLALAMHLSGYRLLFVTGRDVAYKDDTIDWIWKQLSLPSSQYDLLMLPTDDHRKDCDFKYELYRDVIAPSYDVLFCIDDRKQVVDMWRSLGLTCLQCDEGAF